MEQEKHKKSDAWNVGVLSLSLPKEQIAWVREVAGTRHGDVSQWFQDRLEEWRESRQPEKKAS